MLSFSVFRTETNTKESSIFSDAFRKTVGLDKVTGGKYSRTNAENNREIKGNAVCISTAIRSTFVFCFVYGLRLTISGQSDVHRIKQRISG